MVYESCMAELTATMRCLARGERSGYSPGHGQTAKSSQEAGPPLGRGGCVLKGETGEAFEEGPPECD